MDKLRVKGLAFSKTGTDDGFKKSVSLHPLLTRGHVLSEPRRSARVLELKSMKPGLRTPVYARQSKRTSLRAHWCSLFQALS